jgi:hypothetical protein
LLSTCYPLDSVFAPARVSRNSRIEHVNSVRSLYNLALRFAAEQAKPSDAWSSHLDNDSGNRNDEYGSRSKKGPDSQLLAFVTTNPESRRTKDEIVIEPETSFEEHDVASRWITPPQNMP